MQVEKFYLCVEFSHIYRLNTNITACCNWTQHKNTYKKEETNHWQLQ